MNMLYDVSQDLGCDWEIHTWCGEAADPRIGGEHTHPTKEGGEPEVTVLLKISPL